MATRYLLKRGHGSRRRKAHLTQVDEATGAASMEPLCGTNVAFNMTSNVPFVPVCKRCTEAARRV